MKFADRKLARRSFLKTLSLAGSLAVSPALLLARSTAASSLKPDAEMDADVVIIGGGLGGCAAALAAARNGLRVIMTEENDWIGGQLTQQAVPPDENNWVESFGGTRSYLALRQKIRDYYVRNYPLTAKAKADARLNPGNGWVSRLCHEPRVALAVLTEMLAPYVGSRKVQVLLRHKAVSAVVNNDRVEAVRVRGEESGHDRILRAPYFLDATEMGDLLPMTGTEYVVGAESRAETGEPHAAAKALPTDLQGFTMCFAMDYLRGEDHTIDRPSEYRFWRDFNVAPTKKFSPEAESPDTPKSKLRLISFDDERSKKLGFDPVERKGWWTYRRIADRDNFQPGFYTGDISLVNWPQNDYSFGNICEVSAATAAREIARAKQQSLSLLYWLQTECPRPDGGTGWKGLRLRPDIVGTIDGLAKYPYIREGRRVRAEFTVLEQHVATDLRVELTGVKREDATAEVFKDSVGIGSYRMDLHPSSAQPGMYASTVPFQIPLGSLIPRRMENLLPACKNLGVTHLTNGCYRLHPVEWNIGESAGALVAYCVKNKRAPREVRRNADFLTDFQSQLGREGVPIIWPQKVGPV